MVEGEAASVVDVVIPTVARPSLRTLLDRLVEDATAVGAVVVVDDRPASGADGGGDRTPADVWAMVPSGLHGRTHVLRSDGRGPAAARNTGWRATTAPWIVFLDDDVVPGDGWAGALHEDVGTAATRVGAVAARLHVPLPGHRRPTDRERQVKALETAGWITADLVVRRELLEQVDGFDERFPRAHREDTDFALRSQRSGWRFEHGRRRTIHPVQPAPWWHSVAAQRGNRDDVLMYALHRWRPDRTRRRRHIWITACGATALAATCLRRRRLATVALAGWTAGTAELVLARIVPGPRTPREVAAMATTSVAIPPVAIAHRAWAKLAIRRQRVRPMRRGATPGGPGTRS